MSVHVSILGVVLAAISAMIVGTLWYSPALFGPSWRKLIGISDEEMKQKMGGATFVLLVAALLTAYVLALFTGYFHAFSGDSWLVAAIDTSLLVWAGFALTTIFVHGVFEPQSKKVLYINAANRLVTLLVMGLILGLVTK
jgi:hypothetical protein